MLLVGEAKNMAYSSDIKKIKFHAIRGTEPSFFLIVVIFFTIFLVREREKLTNRYRTANKNSLVNTIHVYTLQKEQMTFAL